jgi:hypothetical protein
MSTPRDAILNALYLLLKTKLGSNVTTMGRRHMMPPQLTSAMQPALFVVQGPEEKDPRPRGTGGKITLHVFLVAYCYDTASDAVHGTTQLNTLIGQIEDALAPDTFNPSVLTLGGQAYECWIEGQADIDPGVFGQQAFAILPVKILVP